jgi:hypothetical protein
MFRQLNVKTINDPTQLLRRTTCWVVVLVPSTTRHLKLEVHASWKAMIMVTGDWLYALHNHGLTTNPFITSANLSIAA